MAMNPRTHPRGAPPSFALPAPNPNSTRMTNALWWLVCMCELLEPEDSANGGTFANKPGSHNAGENLPDFGEGDSRTDHSIRHEWNRTGPWWREFTAGRDWTFLSAQRGNYTKINLYTKRMIDAMKDPNDLRPDRALFYVLGNTDGDVQTEGYNEIKNGTETSGDDSHAWHIHESHLRNAVGDFWSMWKILTIYMGWTYAEWQRSVAPIPEVTMDWDDKVQEGEVGDTGGPWRSFRQGLADLFNWRNWWYVGEDSTTPVNPPPTMSRASLLYGRVKDLAASLPVVRTDVSGIKAQVNSNGTGISEIKAQLDEQDTKLATMDGKLDQILELLAEPPTEEV